MNNGWIKLHRSLLEWEWWSDMNVRNLWLTILLLANHDEKKWQGQTIASGQLVTSLQHLAVRSGLSIQQTRTALEKLKSTGEINTQSTNRNTIITVIKWADFQCCDEIPTSKQQTNNKQITNEQQTDNKQITTNKNDKNDKNEKNIDYLKIIDLFHEVCPSFPHIRTVSENRKKAIRARMKIYSIEDFRTLFEKAEASDFLKGGNNRNWTADFDWLIKDSNMPKVLEGKYDNRQRSSGNSKDWDFTDFANLV